MTAFTVSTQLLHNSLLVNQNQNLTPENLFIKWMPNLFSQWSMTQESNKTKEG